jgi:hypothetical protein
MSRRMTAGRRLAARLAAASALLLGAAGAQAQATLCQFTNWGSPFAAGCTGAMPGDLTGAPAELATLASTWSESYIFVGRSDEPDFGPFASNPQVAFNGQMTFDSTQTGTFVLGVVSAGQHSFYRFVTKRRIGGLSFDSLEGVATTPQGNPFPLSYAALYRMNVSVVPEPATVLLFTLGLAGLALRRLRRQD